MAFKYNPITNQLDITSTSGGGGGVTTITATSPLKANGVSGTPVSGSVTISTGASPSEITINGNTSYVTGSTVTLTCGAYGVNGTAAFNGNGTTTMTLNSTDSNGNVGWGQNVFSTLPTGTGLVAIGQSACSSGAGGGTVAIGQSALNLAASGGEQNTAIGWLSGAEITTGAYNCLYGSQTGYSYHSSESNNILIGYNVRGTLGESNTLRIGVSTGTGIGQVSTCYIQGIYNNNSSGFTSPLPVYVDSSNGQLGYGSSSGLFPQIIVSAQFTGTASAVTGDGTWTNVVYDTALVNVGSCLNTGTGEWTVPATGVYLISASIQPTLPSSATYIQQALWTSGGSQITNISLLSGITWANGAAIITSGQMIISATSGHTYYNEFVVGGGSPGSASYGGSGSSNTNLVIMRLS